MTQETGGGAHDSAAQGAAATTAAVAENEAPPQATAAPDGPYEVSEGVYKRLTTGLSGYVMAMLACFLLVGVVWLLTPRKESESLPRADYQGHALALRQSAPYTAYVPEGLPAGWRATSSRLTGDSGKAPVAWHVGFVTPSDEYAALEESNENADAFAARMANNKLPTGTQQVAGAQWERRYRADKKQNSLVRRLPGVTLVVTGTASYDELAVLAASLRPQAKTPS